MALDVRWLPFELHADTPPAGIDLAGYLAAASGDLELDAEETAERWQASQRYLQQRATEVDLPFQPPRRLPNSRRALALAEYARRRDEEERRTGAAPVFFQRVHHALFHAYFAAGRDIGDLDVLRELAAEAGLDGAEALSHLDDKEYTDVIDASMARAAALGISGTPTFILDGRYVVVGAQPHDVLRKAFVQVAEERMEKE